MKNATRNYLWILVANGLLIALVAVIFFFKMTGSVADDANKNPIDPALLTGEMQKFEVFEPRKNMPQVMFLQDLQTATDIRDLKGQWTLVNLWASWCAPCLTELPSLQRLHDVYNGKGFRVIAIALDTASDPLEIQGIIAAKRLGSITKNWDYGGEVFRILTDGSLPVSFLLDPEGRVVARMKGPAEWATPETLALIDALVKASK